MSCKKDNAEPGGGGNTGGDGRFSVSSTTTVEFAPGNLWYDGSAFRFEENQWSFASTWNPSHVSHFKWSDAANAVTGDYSYSGDLFCNNNFTVAGDSHTWRTLSGAEWDYLLYTRDNASSLRAWVTLSDVSVSGLVLLPDGSTATASGITTSSALADAGAVFLPAAGYRIGTDVDYVGSFGFYWSSTPNEYDEDYAYFMYFLSGDASSGNYTRDFGYSVRLVW